MDSEYEALMAELGGGKPKGPLGQPKSQSLTQNLGSQQAHINRVRKEFTLLCFISFSLMHLINKALVVNQQEVGDSLRLINFIKSDNSSMLGLVFNKTL